MYTVKRFNACTGKYDYYNCFNTYTEACEACEDYTRMYGKGFKVFAE